MGWLAGGATPGFLGPGVTSPMRLCACLLVIALLANLSFCVSACFVCCNLWWGRGGSCLSACLLVYNVQSLTFLLTFLFVCQRLFCLLLTCRGCCLCDCLLAYKVQSLTFLPTFLVVCQCFCFDCFISLGRGRGSGCIMSVCLSLGVHCTVIDLLANLYFCLSALVLFTFNLSGWGWVVSV